MDTLCSYVAGQWREGSGDARLLVDPSTEEVVAQSRSEGFDVPAAFEHARTAGGGALNAMTFAERGAMLRALSDAVVAARPRLLELSMINNGATRSDAKFDVDGASFTLGAYAELGEALGDRTWLVDGEVEELARSRKLGGVHLRTSRSGLALHINAFNFPAWGLAEKAAVAWLAGMPVVSKPATATAWTAFELARCLVDSGALPEGAMTFFAGRPPGLVESLQTGDVLAFTGSNAVGSALKADARLAREGVPVNVEADSLNAAVLGPDVEPGDEAWDLMVRDVFRDMRQKTGQKCTAIRRVLVPEARADELVGALEESRLRLRIGDPRAEGVRMGPLVSEGQRRDVLAGLERLDGVVDRVMGSGRPLEVHGVDAERGFFVDIHLFRARTASDSLSADVVHDEEVFGPAATVLPYDGSVEQATTLLARGRGSLVGSLYSEDRRWIRDLVLGAACWHGRLTLGSRRIADASPGPGTVLPQMVHGGPGRAGGGEELGGVRGLELYMQRTAVQGYRPLLERFFTTQ